MALNIKNERVCALARDVAARTGQNQTAAIESALERYLEELLADTEQARREAEMSERRARAKAILARIRQRITDEDREATRQFMSEMYDESGLPR